MEIYRISCFVMFAMMLISGVLLIVFPRLRHRENFYMKMLNNLNVGFFSGLMVSFSIALASYFYARENFLSALFQQSRYIYVSLEDIVFELQKSESKTPYLVNLEAISAPCEAIKNDAKSINFLTFSPFFRNSEMALQVKTLQGLYAKFEKYPTFFTRMQFLQSERAAAQNDFDTDALNTIDAQITSFSADLKREVEQDLATLENFIGKLKEENSDRYIPWENFKAVSIAKAPKKE